MKGKTSAGRPDGATGDLPRRQRARRVGSVVAAGSMLSALVLSVGAGATTANAAGAFPQVLKEGGALTVLETATQQGAWPQGLDPAVDSSGGANQDMEDAIFGMLFELGPNGVTVPDEATGYKFLDAGKTVQISIRPGLKFSDGTPFNAAAVVSNWQRDFKLDDSNTPPWPVVSFTQAGPLTADEMSTGSSRRQRWPRTVRTQPTSLRWVRGPSR
jgi:peptide/nickel transport system substrate-binding protein